MHVKTEPLLGNFSFGLNNFLIFQQRFLFNVFNFFYIKKGFLTFFILGVNVFYIYDWRSVAQVCNNYLWYKSSILTP